jgi:hypothetical protein
LIHSAASSAGQGFAIAGAERFSALFERGRAEARGRGKRTLPASTGEYFALVVVALAARRVREAKSAALPEEGPAMAALVKSCYLEP